VSDLMRELSGRAAVEAAGRHALDEDAVLTPIFHALTRGGWRSRQHEVVVPVSAQRAAADPVDAFHRDPLTAPIPVQALVAPPATSRRRARGGVHRVPAARHARHDEALHAVSRHDLVAE
jgi:hypothetical protein